MPQHRQSLAVDTGRARVIAALREEIARLEKAEAEVRASLQELRALLAELESPP